MVNEEASEDFKILEVGVFDSGAGVSSVCNLAELHFRPFKPTKRVKFKFVQSSPINSIFATSFNGKIETLRTGLCMNHYNSRAYWTWTRSWDLESYFWSLDASCMVINCNTTYNKIQFNEL